MRTTLEQYQAIEIQMLMARGNGRDEEPYCERLDVLWKLLTDDEKEFLNEMGQEWAKYHKKRKA